MKLLRSVFAAGCLLLLASPAAAQLMHDWAPHQGYMSRAELEKLLNRLENAAASPEYGRLLQDEARIQAGSVWNRLQYGDFQVGDRIVLEVEAEPALTDTFTVDQGRVIDLPTVGRLPLHGVLRSELESNLHQFLGRYLREPVVRARSLIRVTVLGGVRQPGFYTIRSEAPLTDALMKAGGPTPRAKLEEVRVERGESRVWAGEPLQHAIAQGRTLDQLNLMAGDRIFVPETKGGLNTVESTVRTLSLILSIPLSIFAVTQIF